jgi:hypothetical protein
MTDDEPPHAAGGSAVGTGSGGVTGDDAENGGRRFFDRLSADGQRLVPVLYRFLHRSSAGSQAPTRLAESRHHRAAGYICYPFHKPISKCRLPEDGRE